MHPKCGGFLFAAAVFVGLALMLWPVHLAAQGAQVPEACTCTVTVTAPQTVMAWETFQVQASPSFDPSCNPVVSYAWVNDTGEWPQDLGAGPGPWYLRYDRNPGVYHWTFIVYINGWWGCKQEGTITVGPSDCTLACDATASEVQVPRNVQFTGTITKAGTCPYADIWWDFGDGNGSSALSPTHYYQADGAYNWKLSVTMGYSPNYLASCAKTGTVVVGGKKCLDVGQFKICAATLANPTPTNPKYLFEGDVTVNDVLYLPGVVSFEGTPQNGYGTLTAPGGIQIKTNRGTQFLLDADTRNSFEVQGSDKTLLPNFDTSAAQLGIEFGGVPMILAGSSIALTDRGPYCEPTCLIGVEGAATLCKAKVKILFPPGAGALFQGTEVTLGQLTPSITLAQAGFTYDAFQDKFEGTFKLALPESMGDLSLEGNIRVLAGCLDGAGITVPVPEYPLGTTGLKTKDGTFELSGICTRPVTLFLGGNLRYLAIPDALFSVDHVGLKWQPLYTCEVDGGTAMLAGYPMANVKGRLNVADPFLWITGKMNVAETLNGDADIKLILYSLSGTGTGNLALRINDFSCSPTSLACRAIRTAIRSVVTLPFTATEAKTDIRVRWDILASPPVAYMDFQGMFGVGPLSLAAAVDLDKYGVHLRVGTNYEDMISIWGARESAASGVPETERTIAVPAGQERVIFAVVTDAAVPSIYLRDPQGQTITPANAAGFPGVSHFVDGGDTVALFRVEKPAAGTWVLGEQSLPPGQCNFLALGPAPPPTASFASVTQGGNAVSVSVGVTPASPETKVALYYAEGADGSADGIIAEGLPATAGTVSATWDTSEVPSGTYYLLARVSDGKNPPVTALYGGSVPIDRGGPQPPTGLAGSRSGDAVTLAWTPSATPGVAGYKVKYTQDPGTPGYPHFVSTDSSSGLTLAGLDPAKNWRFCLQAFDGDGNFSPESGAVTLPAAGATPGDCDGNGAVSIGEVQKAINMYLGSLATGCGADGNGDGSVSIGEVQKVINAFLGIPLGVSVSVNPSTATVAAGGTQQFAATVTGTANTAVTWSVQEGASGGSVTGAGLYTAPQAAGTFHVRATSQADPSKSGSATVTVTEPPQCTLACTASADPSTGSAPLAVSFTCTATPTGCPDPVIYAWTFGDGATSAQQNPSHTYAAAGTYAWALTASSGSATCPQSGAVTVTAPADGTPLTLGIPVSGAITGASQNASWNWYYLDVAAAQNLAVDVTGLTGDVDLYVRFDQKPDLATFYCRSWNNGTTAEHCAAPATGPTRVWIGVTNYSVGGPFQYTLAASLDTCAITSCQATATPLSGLTANFAGEYQQTGCTVPPTFLWFFGDDGEGINQNVIHTFPEPGTYPWTFVVFIGDVQCDTSGTVTVPGP